MTNLDGTSTCVKAEVAAHGAYVNRSASGFGIGSSANVIELHAPAAALGFHTSGDSRGVNVAPLRFQLHQRHFARDHHREFSRKMARPPSALPISHDPGGVAFHVRGHFVLLELAACILL